MFKLLIFYYFYFRVRLYVGSAWSFALFIPATTANDLRIRRISIPDIIRYICFSYFKLYLFLQRLRTRYTTYINRARWHRCLRSDGLRDKLNE